MEERSPEGKQGEPGPDSFESEYLGKAVRISRILSGMAYRHQLAEKVGVSSEMVRSIEKGWLGALTITDAMVVVSGLNLNRWCFRDMMILINDCTSSFQPLPSLSHSPPVALSAIERSSRGLWDAV